MLQIGFVPPSEIEEMAQEARHRFCLSKVPVDVEFALDVKLGLDLVPVPGLQDRISGDAFTARDWSAIYYDPHPSQTRIRYSFAHELGHFLMHKQAVDGLPPTKDVEEWSKLYTSLPLDAVGRAETQANMFASAFLMPSDDLTNRFTCALEQVEPLRQEAAQAGVPRGVYIDHVVDRIATILAPAFDVSIEAMTWRIQNFCLTDRIP